MADPFSIVSGALGVVGVALAVGDEARKLRNLHKRFRNAANDSLELSKSMELLITLLDAVEFDMKEITHSNVISEPFLYKTLAAY